MSQGRFLQWHIKKHNITSKEYYDKFIRRDNEGYCHKCGGETQFITFSVGYNTYCSTVCVALDPKTREKSSETKISKYGDPNFNNRDLAKETVVTKYGVTNVSKNNEIKEKKRITYLCKLSVDNPMKNESVKHKGKQSKLDKYGDENFNNRSKAKNTMVLKYGVDNYSKSYYYRKYKEKLNEWVPQDQLSEFKIYYRKVWNLTKKNKPQLIELWGGLCYYSGIGLSYEYHYNHPNYPTIDHKISVYNGFINNIPYEFIGSLDNLCICSREMNNKKNILNENNFKIK